MYQFLTPCSQLLAEMEVQNDFLVLEDGLNISLGSSISDKQLDEDHAKRPLSRKLLKGKIQAGVQNRVSNFWREKVGSYVMQGDYLALHMEEQSCLSWKSFLWDIPQGVLKFAINAGINTLPSGDNLKRWGKRVSDRCGFCGNVQTLAHILTNCSVALEQGRFTWRHDSILRSIIAFMDGKLRPGFRLFSDLEGFQAPGGGVIPPNILTTTLRPDLFLVDEARSLLVLFELTSPWETNIERSHTYKEGKYAPLVADLSRDYTVLQFSVEISARGFISKPNKARLKALSLKCCEVGNADIKRFMSACSKAAILSS